MFKDSVQIIESTVDTDYELTLRVYDTLEEVFEALYKLPIKELLEGAIGVCDQNDNEAEEISFSEILDVHKNEVGCYGFADPKQKIIHIWYRVGIAKLNLLRLISHEIGHLTRPKKRDHLKEKLRRNAFLL